MANLLPVIAGVAQFNPRAIGMSEAPEPLMMMDRVARAAADDSGAPDILRRVDALAVVNVTSARYQNAPDALAGRLGINPKRCISTTFGGNTPQYLINHFAREIAAGRIRAAMVVGAEAIYTARHAAKSGGVKWNPTQGTGKPEILGDPRMGTNAYEDSYGARLPIQIYPLFENAYRARKGWTIGEHRERFGRLCSAMTKVAADNPYAWFRKERAADEIVTATPDNRIICFPYTKTMNAIMEVDLAAAVIIASADEARTAGVTEAKMVYIHSAADATDSWWISERDSFAKSPTLDACASAVLQGAGIDATEVSHFDFYSCFPVALEFAMEAVRMELGDPRGVTLTGGLPYAGGPANNYVTHSVAAMTQRLRDRAGQFGMTTGLGWYFTKHAAAIYSTRVPPNEFKYEVFKEPAKGSVVAVENPQGPATIETYTIEHDRSGDPSSAIVVARLENGERFFARAPRELLRAMELDEYVGKRGRVRNLDGVNLFEPI